LQIIFHKRATKYRSLLRKMTYKDKGSYESSPPCTYITHTHLRTRALSQVQKTLLTDCRVSSKKLYSPAKEPYTPSKEPCTPSKEPYTPSKEPYTPSKELCSLSKKPLKRISSRVCVPAAAI